jgi:F0F1-type ATP synthase assembly protein I
MSDIAFSLISPIILGFIVGHYIDRHYHSNFPIWSISLTFLGIIVGMWGIYKRYIK